MPLIATLTMNPALDVTTSTPRVRSTDKLRCSIPSFEPGGGGINVARVVHELGGEASAIFPSGGPAGETIERLLGDMHVSFVTVPIAGATRESLTVDEAESGDQFRFVMPGPELTAAEVADCLAGIEGLRPSLAYVVASGSLPPGVADDIFVEVSRLCDRLGARFVLDTSGSALRRAAGMEVFLLKPNLREARDLLSRDIADPAAEMAAARELVDRSFAEVVVMSLGARGAVVADRSGVERLEGLEVEPRSAVGAGDSMVAGILFGLDRGLPLHQAVRLGMSAGAAALLTPGSGLARRGDVERLFGGPLPD